MYTRRCPYCGKLLGTGALAPTKKLGRTVLRRCWHCGGTYKDGLVVDWDRTSALKKFLYFLDNGRFWLLVCFPAVQAVIIREIFDLEAGKSMMALYSMFVFLNLVLCIRHVNKQVKQYRKEKEEAEKATLRKWNLCQYCGGSFKGLFVKQCKACGKKKDY